ncbi:MAG: redoxin domain-containing protein [Bacteroidales bacterium]|nr:redoxin domain-containing protein [Bacteroidales bacterium]
MKKTIPAIILFLFIVSGCRNTGSFKIQGFISEPQKKSVVLKRLDIGTSVLVDTAIISKKGSFRFKAEVNNPEFFTVGYDDTDFITILAAPGEKIKLSFPEKNLSAKYSVSGSLGSEQVHLLDSRLAEARKKLDSLRMEYSKIEGTPDFEARAPLIEKEFGDVVKELRKKNIEFIITNTKSMAALKALYQKIDDDTYVMYDTRDLQYMKIVADSLGRYYPESKHVKALGQDLKNELGRYYTLQLKQMTDTIPETRLDPELADISGKRIRLSSLRGKVVLLAFWSAASRDCIAENLQLKEFYKLYNKKGFEIYQINLDADESVWKNAVKFDELPWISTREDDPSNPKYANLFNVQSLPYNYLFDRNGNIIATNLHGRPLQIKLNQLFTN